MVISIFSYLKTTASFSLSVIICSNWCKCEPWKLLCEWNQAQIFFHFVPPPCLLHQELLFVHSLLYCSLLLLFFSPVASQRCWATNAASSSSTRWSSAFGCWPSALSSVSSWDATTWCRRSPTSSRSPSKKRSPGSSWLPSGWVERSFLFWVSLHFKQVPEGAERLV